MNQDQRKATLLSLFQAGVDAVGGVQATQRALADDNLQATLSKPLHLVAIGKAADAMARGALSVANVNSGLVSALVITKHDHLGESIKADARFECIESGHPVPDENSLLAGARLQDYVSQIPESHSLIKGGKLANVVRCEVLQLLISDVPGDKPGDIGSGLLVPDVQTGMKPELAVWEKVQTHVIASSSIAQAAVCKEAQNKKLKVIQPTGSLDGDIHDVCTRVAHVLSQAEPGVYVWGGEPTVVLPATPGRGGRNQHLALSLVNAAATHGAVSILVCGTDGTDGPTNDAGGLIDEASAALAEKNRLDPTHALQRADAGSVLDALDLLVTTGPSGTNVMDLCIAIVDG